MFLICYLCAQGLTSASAQRRGAHSRCLLAQSRHPRPPGHLRLMSLTRSRTPIVVEYLTGRTQAYLFRIALQGRTHRRSILGRCWIEWSQAPATVRTITPWTPKCYGA